MENPPSSSRSSASEPRAMRTQLTWFVRLTNPGATSEAELNHVYDGKGTADSPFQVTWTDGDRGNPENWSLSLKMLISGAVGLQYLVTAISSSALSGALTDIHMQTSSSYTLAVGCIAVFVLGFGVGPLLWAPLSERFGRQPINLIASGGYAITSTACVFVTDRISALILLRSLAGAFGSASVACSASVVAEVFRQQDRRLAMSLFALLPALGPTLGPAIGGFIGESGGLQWLFGSLAIFSAFAGAFSALTVPETYGPRILQLRARALTKETGMRYEATHANPSTMDNQTSFVSRALGRPWCLLALEPIVMALSVYSGLAYGTLYLFFAAYPVVFQVHRGWSSGLTGLAFLSMAVGMGLAVVVEVGLVIRGRRRANHSYRPTGPETHLVGCMLGAFFIPLGIFWFAWTSRPDLPWSLPLVAGMPFGFGLMLVLLSTTNYLVHTYTVYAASAFAASNIFRYLCGAGFPLLAPVMYRNLGTEWASSVPGFLSLACAPAPFLLYRYGPDLRARGPYCTRAAQIVASMQRG